MRILTRVSFDTLGNRIFETHALPHREEKWEKAIGTKVAAVRARPLRRETLRYSTINRAKYILVVPAREPSPSDQYKILFILIFIYTSYTTLFEIRRVESAVPEHKNANKIKNM